jgi:hypothetical protein
VKCFLIDEYVKKPSAHGMSTFNESSVSCQALFYVILVRITKVMKV